MPSRFRLLPIALSLLTVACAAFGQSLKVNNPTHLSTGVNNGTVDSFTGDQFWDFYVNPGKFQLTFSGGNPQEGFTIGGRTDAGIAFVPKTPGAVFTQRTLGNGTMVFTGSVQRRTRVGIVVEAPRSALVRQTVAYTLVASGSADTSGGGGPSAPPSVAGMYAAVGGWSGSYGVARFSADGNIVTTNGQHGHWEMFDAESRIYVISIGSDRRTLIFQPARGFIDSVNQNLALEARR